MPSRSEAPTGLSDALEALAQGAMRLARQEASASGLSMPQYFILRRLHRHGPVPATWWAEQAGLRASSVSELVDGLVRAHWVARSPDPLDRRRILIRLSPRGERLLARIQRARRRRVEAMLRGMDPHEVAHATAVVSELARRFPARKPPGSKPGARRRTVPKGVSRA